MPHTAEEERLLNLMRELMSRREYITGDAPFPGGLTRADAAAIAADVHLAVDQGTAARTDIAARQGSPVACHAGCNACCEQLVMIWAAEAELIVAWLSEPEHAAVKDRFLAAYPRWLAQTGDAIDKVYERTDARDATGQLAALVAHWRQHVMCAFNQDGLCTIYEVRPEVCRSCHALDTSENCRPADDTGSAATGLYFQPLEELLDKTRSLSKAMHHALGARRGRSEALCTAVYERLQR